MGFTGRFKLMSGDLCKAEQMIAMFARIVLALDASGTVWANEILKAGCLSANFTFWLSLQML